MKSRTKNILSTEQITKLVKENFGSQTQIGKIEELKGGMFNSAYRIERIAEADTIILKVSVRPGTPVLTYEKDLMATEVAVYRLIAEHTTVPVPQILCADFSKSLIDSDYFFMTALRGTVMYGIQKKLPPQDLRAIKEELARYFAQIHQVKGPYFGYFSDDPARQFSTWEEAFEDMFHNILQDGRAHRVNLPYQRIEKVLKKHMHLLDAIQEPSLVDYDLWPGNIFLTNDAGHYQIEGIVDFERAFWGDPYADFPPIFILDEDIWKDKHFWLSYTQTLGVPKEITADDQLRMTLYKLYIWVIMCVESYRYNFVYGLLTRLYATRRAKQCIKLLEAQ